MILKKKLTPGAILTLSWGYIHVDDLYSQTHLLVNTGLLKRHENLLVQGQVNFEDSLVPSKTYLSDKRTTKNR